LNHAGILQKGNIALLKKKQGGPRRQTPARPAQTRGLPRPLASEPVSRRPIQIGRRTVFFPARHRMHAGGDVGLGFLSSGELTERAAAVVGGWIGGEVVQ
jgi:hypothetical protein